MRDGVWHPGCQHSPARARFGVAWPRPPERGELEADAQRGAGSGVSVLHAPWTWLVHGTACARRLPVLGCTFLGVGSEPALNSPLEELL